MTIELLQNLSLASYILAAVLFVLAVVLFFLLDIKKVIGDVTGATARRAIQNIREQNEASGDKAYKSSPVNLARGKVTDKITPSGRLKPRADTYGRTISTEELAETKPAPASNETTVLAAPVPTAQTTVLAETGPAPTECETPDTAFAVKTALPEESKEEFKIDVEMSFIGSSEIIE